MPLTILILNPAATLYLPMTKHSQHKKTYLARSDTEQFLMRGMKKKKSMDILSYGNSLKLVDLYQQ